MDFRFDFDKTLQAAAVLLEQSSDGMDFIRLLKLLYIADREKLKLRGYTITGDQAFAMKYGPVLGHTYRILKGEATDAAKWAAFVGKDGYRIHLLKSPGKGKLCREDVAILKDVTEKFKDMGDFDLCEETHNFWEWKQHFCGGSTLIPWDDVVRAVGNEERLPAYEQEQAERRKMDELFEVSP